MNRRKPSAEACMGIGLSIDMGISTLLLIKKVLSLDDERDSDTEIKNHYRSEYTAY